MRIFVGVAANIELIENAKTATINTIESNFLTTITPPDLNYGNI